MRPAKLSVGPVLWLAGWCLLVAGHSSEQKDPWQPPSPQSGSENWPHPKKSATLVPAFIKTTTAPHKHTTTHHHHRHTTTTAPANHTTAHATTTSKKPTTTHHTATTTSKKPTTTHHATTTSKKPTTTHHATTTSKMPTTTHHATTTSKKPTTTHATTHHATTTPEKPTTAHNATTAPANHTSAAPRPTTTTPRPTQPPTVLVGNYTVKQGAGVCLRAEMGLQLLIRYTDKAKRQVWGAFAVQPNRTNASGTCSNMTATLKLRFPEGIILFTFQKNETEKVAYLSQVHTNLTYQFPQATESTFRADNASLREFTAPLGKCYQCRNRSLALSDRVRLTALSERVQAFQLQDGKFGEAEVCPEQKRSIVLPVVVGVVLALLIIIVFVAFAVGRWRGRTGYEPL